MDDSVVKPLPELAAKGAALSSISMRPLYPGKRHERDADPAPHPSVPKPVAREHGGRGRQRNIIPFDGEPRA
jgi:hypothetical protein